MLNMVKTMFDGFKVNIELEVLGSIVKTNAEYANGSRLTLLESYLGAAFPGSGKAEGAAGQGRPGRIIVGSEAVLEGREGNKD